MPEASLGHNELLFGAPQTLQYLMALSSAVDFARPLSPDCHTNVV
jgi:hypothetical protein